MLDTNAVRALLDGRSPRLDGWLAEQQCCLSVIVAAEIRYGLERRVLPANKRQLIEGALEALEILPWSEGCARTYGRLRAQLEQRGKPLGLMDLLIASHALSEGCSLVSADQAFAQVDELTLESW
ncbi:type II toxin-antitoxin system VapC family toxin [Cyanobium sp. ATX 6F1]|uniref:type II toxin-antitoxin system VapC family toxin n=1 Tax=unclassified Cyanobium TaxID=2627006 RepID=UPI0020CD12A2|nr:type II toxin-antitoxin system VapC family toxin [Cyanobium sp. ATX 6F1]MCP9917558.1 type II toxin-antitoxin system VapC family toxin [Cyanobium sp. ATX 6F1]